MYRDSIFVPANFWALRGESSVDKGMSTPWGYFALLYTVAIKYHIKWLQDLAIDACIIHVREYNLNLGIINYVYSNTAPGNNLRRLLVSITRWDSSTTALDSMDLDPMFRADIDAAGQEDGNVMRVHEIRDPNEPWDIAPRNNMPLPESLCPDFLTQVDAHLHGEGCECGHPKAFTHP